LAASAEIVFGYSISKLVMLYLFQTKEVLKVFKKVFLVSLLVVGLAVGLALPAQAEGEDHKSTVWAQSGGKTVFDEALIPGRNYVSTVQLYNDSDQQSISHFKVTSYGVRADGSYSATDIAVMERTELTKWVTYANGQDTYDIILEPRQTVDVPFTISVPDDWVASGSQSAALVISSEDYAPDAPKSEQGLTIETEYLHLLFANVGGSEPLRIDAQFLGLDVPSILFSASQGLPMKMLFTNEGNVWTTAQYHIEVTDKIRYDAVAYERTDSKELLVGNEVTVEQTWSEMPELGWFNVRATVTIGGEEFIDSKTVIVFPLWLLIILAAMIILLVTALILKVRKHHEKRQKT
jgi:hypothetical protein